MNYFLLFAYLILFGGCEKSNLSVTNNNQKQFTKCELRSAPSSSYSLIWHDEFDGSSLNSDYWTLGFKDSASGDSVPGAWGKYLLNGYSYAGYVTDEDCWLSDGSLFLRNQKRTYIGTNPPGTYAYTSSSIMSMHKVYMNKGYIECRAKFPIGDKVWPAIWFCAEDIIWGPEIDWLEYFGYREDQGYDVMGMHLMTGTYPNITWYSHFIKQFDNLYNAQNYHVYGFEWTSTYMKWYIDGTLVYTLNANGVSNWPDENMYLLINNGERVESPDITTVWPNQLEVDYIRIYQVPISNTGFETGNASGWSPYGSTSVVNNNQHSGNYCAKITADYSGYEYTVSGLQPNTSYIFSGFIKAGSSGQFCHICAKEYGGIEVTASTSSTSYQPLSVTFTTGPTNHSAKVCFFRWGDGSGVAYGDDFQLYSN